MWGMKALNDGERKFWINQNFTRLSVCRRTDTIIRVAIRCEKREKTIKPRIGKAMCEHTSYSNPDATVKILISARFPVSTKALLSVPVSLGERKGNLKETDQTTSKQVSLASNSH